MLCSLLEQGHIIKIVRQIRFRRAWWGSSRAVFVEEPTFPLATDFFVKQSNGSKFVSPSWNSSSSTVSTITSEVLEIGNWSHWCLLSIIWQHVRDSRVMDFYPAHWFDRFHQGMSQLTWSWLGASIHLLSWWPVRMDVYTHWQTVNFYCNSVGPSPFW